ncbi:MAG: hypothetical protein HYS86_01650 [Candidatus Chisholmbacteria bacterium]|nr:hypothetical protein [Candidatus Chisholmbacteria bacterium]
MKKRLLERFFQRKQGANRGYLRRRQPRQTWRQQTSPLMVTQLMQMQKLGQPLILAEK